jgi:hypothetical protein
MLSDSNKIWSIENIQTKSLNPSDNYPYPIKEKAGRFIGQK